MKRRSIWRGIGSGVCMLILILDSKTALDGASLGITICIKTVIPSLFPFFVLSTLITGSLSGQQLSVLRPLGKVCGLPKGGEAFLISAFLGGYPVGAQCVAQAWRDGLLSRQESERMLCFCNNAGPAFLFGMGATLFPNLWMVWALWGIHVLSAVIAAVSIPGNPDRCISMPERKPPSLPEAVRTSLSVMASVCGWVILFRIGIEFLSRWVLLLLPAVGQAAVIGLLEISNGCCLLSQIPEPYIRFTLFAAFISFGGLCVTMQTISVTNGLSLRPYVIGKLIQGTVSIFLAAAMGRDFCVPAFLAVFLIGLFLIKFKKRSSFRGTVGV